MWVFGKEAAVDAMVAAVAFREQNFDSAAYHVADLIVKHVGQLLVGVEDDASLINMRLPPLAMPR
jgi:putative NIF3 family GTP cyclohydrolase 1 type 2